MFVFCAGGHPNYLSDTGHRIGLMKKEIHIYKVCAILTCESTELPSAVLSGMFKKGSWWT